MHIMCQYLCHSTIIIIIYIYIYYNVFYSTTDGALGVPFYSHIIYTVLAYDMHAIRIRSAYNSHIIHILTAYADMQITCNVHTIYI